MLDNLIAGKIPDDVSPLVKRRGAPKIGPDEQKDIGLAVAYVKAARSKLIKDHSPIETVAKKFKVTHRAASRWASELSWIEPVMFLDGIPTAEYASVLLERFSQAAKRYSELGHTNSAIRKRASKRTKG